MRNGPAVETVVLRAEAVGPVEVAGRPQVVAVVVEEQVAVVVQAVAAVEAPEAVAELLWVTAAVAEDQAAVVEDQAAEDSAAEEIAMNG